MLFKNECIGWILDLGFWADLKKTFLNRLSNSTVVRFVYLRRLDPEIKCFGRLAARRIEMEIVSSTTSAGLVGRRLGEWK